jgi:hypothetical protein
MEPRPTPCLSRIPRAASFRGLIILWRKGSSPLARARRSAGRRGRVRRATAVQVGSGHHSRSNEFGPPKPRATAAAEEERGDGASGPSSVRNARIYHEGFRAVAVRSRGPESDAEAHDAAAAESDPNAEDETGGATLSPLCCAQCTGVPPRQVYPRRGALRLAHVHMFIA